MLSINWYWRFCLPNYTIENSVQIYFMLSKKYRMKPNKITD